MAGEVMTPPADSGGNIRVCIRVRPPNQRELALPGGVIVAVPSPTTVCDDNNTTRERRNYLVLHALISSPLSPLPVKMAIVPP